MASAIPLTRCVTFGVNHPACLRVYFVGRLILGDELIKKLLSHNKSSAVFSSCRMWRYTLTRQWDPDKPSILFIGLNPSTGTEKEDDPTIRRCLNFAKSWGYGTYVMCNMFGFRSTDPSILTNLADPNGPDNDHWIRIEAEKASAVVVAWGCHKMTHSRADRVLSLIQNPLCLGTTHNGSPRHPLYVLGSRQPEPYVKSSDC